MYNHEKDHEKYGLGGDPNKKDENHVQRTLFKRVTTKGLLRK